MDTIHGVEIMGVDEIMSKNVKSKEDRTGPCRVLVWTGPTPVGPEEEVRIELTMEYKREKYLCFYESHPEEQTW